MPTRATTKTGLKKSGPPTDLISKVQRAPKAAPPEAQPEQKPAATATAPPTPAPEAPSKAVKETVSLIEPKVKAPRRPPSPEGKARSVLPPISGIRAVAP